MKSSKQSRRDGKQLFRSCLVDGRLDEARVRLVVQAVTDTRPRGWLSALNHFKRLLQLEIERRSARVESPAPLPAAMQEEIKAGLGRLYGAGLQFEFRENKALLGGLRLRVGSDVLDGSVQARLAALEASF